MLVIIAVIAAGCEAPGRPYARDPLVREGTAVRGDPTRTESRELAVTSVPLPPRPPEPTSLADSGRDPNHPEGQISLISPPGR
jgi:hypothetical protein